MADTIEQAEVFLSKSKETGQIQLNDDVQQSTAATVSSDIKDTGAADEFLLAEDVDTQEDTEDESDEVKKREVVLYGKNILISMSCRRRLPSSSC